MPYRTDYVKAKHKNTKKDNLPLWVDSEAFAKDIAEAANRLEAIGYEIISITPVIQGMYAHDAGTVTDTAGILGGKEIAGAYGYGFGYSLTQGAMIVARSSE